MRDDGAGPLTEPVTPVRRIRVTDFHAAKRKGERWAMLTSYDQYTAALFDQAGGVGPAGR